MNNPKLTQVPLDEIYFDPDLMRGGFDPDLILKIIEDIEREAKKPQKPFNLDLSREIRKSRFKDDAAGYTWPKIYSLMKKVHKTYKKKQFDAFALNAQELIESAAEIYWQVIESENCEAINIDYGGGAILFDGDTPIAKIDYQPTTRYYNEHPLPKAVEPLAAIERFIRTGEIESKWCSSVEVDPNHTVVLGSRYSKEDYDGYATREATLDTNSAKQEVVDRLKRSDEIREMDASVANAFNMILEQISDYSLIVGALAFSDSGADRSLLSDSVDRISSEMNLNVAGIELDETIGIAVSKYYVSESLLYASAKAAIYIDDEDLPAHLRTLFCEERRAKEDIGDED